MSNTPLTEGQMASNAAALVAERIVELERELAAEKAARVKAGHSAQVKHQWASALAKTADEYVEQLKTLGDDRNTQRERADTAETALAEERERLDVLRCFTHHRNTCAVTFHPAARCSCGLFDLYVAIDEARKKGT